jgi:hypothetical protein
MSLTGAIRRHIKTARRRGARWVRALDVLRLVPTAEGRSRLWTRLVHGDELHQTSTDTAADRYPELFDLAAKVRPQAQRILSFGCSTGEELLSLRQRFPAAEIVGAEINVWARRLARRLVRHDHRIQVVQPAALQGTFDLIFALAVLQREPHKIAEMEVGDLTPFYPFALFDAAVTRLVTLLRSRGLFCIDNAQYRLEDSSAACQLEPVAGAPRRRENLFGRDGRSLQYGDAGTLFMKT